MASKRGIETELHFEQAKVGLLNDQIDGLKVDKEALQEQVSELQKALVAATAPEAYRDIQFAEAEANRIPLTEEEKEKNRIFKEVTEGYMRASEEPLFTSGEDLDDLFRAGLLRNMQPPKSIHGNDES